MTVAPEKTSMRRLYMAGVLLVLIAVVVGVLAYDYFIGFGSPDDSIPVAPTLEAAGTQQVVFRIDSNQSEVRYNTNEVFLQDNTLGSPIGRTQGIAGDILIDFENPANSQIGEIQINVEQFESDRSMRDGAIRRNYLESSQYPIATFVTTSIENFPENPQEGVPFSFQITGNLTVKATTAEETWDVTVTLSGDQLAGQAKTTILMSTYDVGPIDIAMLRTEDEVRLEFDFVAVRVGAAGDQATAEPTPPS